MDDSVFKLLTSFIVKGRKIAGSIDSERLKHDSAYAEAIFRKVEDEGDEELVLCALKLREALAHTTTPASASSSHAAQDGELQKAKSYVFGARS